MGFVTISAPPAEVKGAVWEIADGGLVESALRLVFEHRGIIYDGAQSTTLTIDTATGGVSQRTYVLHVSTHASYASSFARFLVIFLDSSGSGTWASARNGDAARVCDSRTWYCG